MDETFIKVKGRLVYLYRAIDRDGNLVDVLLSEKRDKAAAEAFSAPHALSPIVSRSGSPLMGMTPIPVLSKPS